MEVLSATEFARGFGKHNQDVQHDVIQVTSHGRPIGYYISAREYEKLQKGQAGFAVNPLYHSIRDEVMKKKEAIRHLAHQHGGRRIFLFGSVARGEDTPGSDIDFLVDFPEVYDLLGDRLQLAAELEEFLGRKIDLVVAAEMNTDIAPAIIEDAIEL